MQLLSVGFTRAQGLVSSCDPNPRQIRGIVGQGVRRFRNREQSLTKKAEMKPIIFRHTVIAHGRPAMRERYLDAARQPHLSHRSQQ